LAAENATKVETKSAEEPKKPPPKPAAKLPSLKKPAEPKKTPPTEPKKAPASASVTPKSPKQIGLKKPAKKKA
jgi:hypothetical protein